MCVNTCVSLNAAFFAIAESMEYHKKEIIEILTDIETFKTAENEVEKTVKTLRTYDCEKKYLEDQNAVGKVAIFLPFNMPLYSLVLYSFGPIYAGNEVYVRPSKITKTTLIKILAVLEDDICTLPLHIVETSGSDFWDFAMNDKDVKAVVFTGQWESVNSLSRKLVAGKKLIYCGSGLCPLIVRENADIELAVNETIKSKIFNCGQDCLATEKIIVHESVADVFINKLLEQIELLIVGDNSNPDTDIGRLATTDFSDRVEELLELTKGEFLRRGNIENGLVEPTVIKVSFGDPIFEEEKFSPVFTIATYSDDSKLIEYINNSDYSLGASVFGSEFINGELKINHIVYNRTVLEFEEDDAHVPFGGSKRSGFVLEDGVKKEGPILFSCETTK